MERNPTWEKWASWLSNEPEEGTIYKEVVDMLASRQIWEGFQEIVKVSPERARKYGTFHTWFNASYIQMQAMAIRRQVEVRDDVVSLGRLLDRVSKAPNVLSREQFIAELYPDDEGIAHGFFDALTSPGARAIAPEMPAGELAHLQSETALIRRWADKEIAHYDPKTGQFSQGLTFGDIHAAIELIFETFNHYVQLILGTTIAESMVMMPWESNFTVAWIPSDEALREVVAAMRARENRRMGVSD